MQRTIPPTVNVMIPNTNAPFVQSTNTILSAQMPQHVPQSTATALAQLYPRDFGLGLPAQPSNRVDPQHHPHPAPNGVRPGPPSAPPRPVPYMPRASANAPPTLTPQVHTLPPMPPPSFHYPTPGPTHPGHAPTNFPATAQYTVTLPPPSIPAPILRENIPPQHTSISSQTLPGAHTPAPTSRPPSTRPSNAVYAGAEDLIALFNAELAKISDANETSLGWMRKQLAREREEKEMLAKRVEELENQLRNFRGYGQPAGFRVREGSERGREQWKEDRAAAIW